jgi:hypothetical protein
MAQRESGHRNVVKRATDANNRQRAAIPSAGHSMDSLPIAAAKHNAFITLPLFQLVASPALSMSHPVALMLASSLLLPFSLLVVVAWAHVCMLFFTLPCALNVEHSAKYVTKQTTRPVRQFF